MVKTNKYLEKLEKSDGILSVVLIENTSNFYSSLLMKMKFPIVYEELVLKTDGNYEYNNIILKTPQNFFINLSKSELVDDWSVNIYYKAESNKELKFFINNLKKQIKNESNNNTRTEK